MADHKTMASRIAEEVARLPPIPSSIHELRHAIANPDVDFPHIVPILKKDPGLSADLLKFVNSARFGVRHRVETIEEAVMYFGMANLIELVNGVFADAMVMKTFFQLKGIDRYVEHSREIAQACGILAATAGMEPHRQHTLSLIGLLHDIGRLVLTIAADQKTIPILGATPERFSEIAIEEKEIWGIDHCDIGSMISRKWKFSDTFIEAIRLHHTRPTENTTSVEAMFVLASHTAMLPDMPAQAIDRMFPDSCRSQMQLTLDQFASAARQHASHPGENP